MYTVVPLSSLGAVSLGNKNQKFKSILPNSSVAHKPWRCEATRCPAGSRSHCTACREQRHRSAGTVRSRCTRQHTWWEQSGAVASQGRRGGAFGRTQRPATRDHRMRATGAAAGAAAEATPRHESRPSPRRDQLQLDRAPLASLSAGGAEAACGGSRQQAAACGASALPCASAPAT